jgi:hypothetical protein
MPLIELAALPPTAQLCLKFASDCQGLIALQPGYVGRNVPADTTALTFGALPVMHLIRHRLLRVRTGRERELELTEWGTALIEHGQLFYEDSQA